MFGSRLKEIRDCKMLFCDVFFEADERQILFDPRHPLFARDAGTLQRQADIFADGFPGQDAGTLKDVTDEWAFLGPPAVDKKKFAPVQAGVRMSIVNTRVTCRSFVLSLTCS
jgi:hypothetical protein